ncbi:hypothetical protein [Phenylobacterium sp.]|uniref:hypothetical protein n=1 Tax=Phenylobacterium sp. TaxID=1871053 RepID=UPI0025F86B92|nr:hypothetical protein [Phenylobacterium sp.]
MDRRLFVLSALAVSGCAAGVRLTPSPAALPELEPLYRADAGREAITISVASNGCTAKVDFTFYVERKGDTARLAFARRRVDACKSFAMGRTELSFSWAELGVARRGSVVLLNPLVAWTGPGA